MAPKKKGNKKGNDDWEAELGETPEPIAGASEEAKDRNAAKDAEAEDSGGGGGGLLAALKKNKSNKKKKGKVVEEDFVEGEDPPGADGLNGHAEPDPIADLANKVPEEANTEDLFVAPAKGKDVKGKGGKKDEAPNEDVDEDGEGGGLKSKKEKEKEKKEREKQRKKEQVRL